MKRTNSNLLQSIDVIEDKIYRQTKNRVCYVIFLIHEFLFA